MENDQYIIKAKELRVEADALLQKMKDSGKGLLHDAYRHNMLSIEAVETAIMRQGMVLKALGTPNPYPNSRDTTNTVVDPTADGLKM